MKYRDFLGRPSFAKPELLAFAHGTLLEDPPDGFAARLPTPPLLMVDRIDEIVRSGSRGRILAAREVQLDDWFFQCHFRGDPVQPGCLGLDGVWQLLGFFCSWAGGLGSGRALGCGEVEFSGQIRPHDREMGYAVEVRRYTELPSSGAALVVGDASVTIDGEAIYSVKQARVGLFAGIAYSDYPQASTHARGGRMRG